MVEIGTSFAHDNEDLRHREAGRIVCQCPPSARACDTCPQRHRNPRRRTGLWPDLGAFTQLRYFRDGRLRWGGFMWDTPNRTDTDAGDAWTLNARGWQFHLDDDLLGRVYVHARPADYFDQRATRADEPRRMGLGAERRDGAIV